MYDGVPVYQVLKGVNRNKSVTGVCFSSCEGSAIETASIVDTCLLHLK